eukprot:365145-Chlamydomonas_euryale.AAC.16
MPCHVGIFSNALPAAPSPSPQRPARTRSSVSRCGSGVNTTGPPCPMPNLWYGLKDLRDALKVRLGNSHGELISLRHVWGVKRAEWLRGWCAPSGLREWMRWRNVTLPLPISMMP